jgi:hypothetical protein
VNERALLETARGDDGDALRLAEVRRFDGSDNLVLRYEVGRSGAG